MCGSLADGEDLQLVGLSDADEPGDAPLLARRGRGRKESPSRGNNCKPGPGRAVKGTRGG